MSKKTGGFLRTLAVLCSAILLFEAGAITPFAEETPGLSFAEEAETGSTSKIQEEEEVIAYLLGEDTGRRDESVKQFRRSDGSMVAALYDEPVHYEVDGEWKEIDNTLVPSENRGGIAYMKNRSNDFTVWLPENMSVGRTVEVGYRGRTLRFALEQTAQTRSAAPQVEGVLRQPETDGGARLRELQASFRETTGLDKTPEAVKECSALSVTANALSPAAADEARNLAREIETEITGVKTISAGVTYADLQPGVDLAYDIQGKSLKESLVLHEGPGAASYSFVLDGGGLTGTLNEDQSVTFCDADGTEFFQIAAPYMWDAANETSYAVDVELQETTGGYLYTITPDADWLTAAERVYPVTIDPTIFTRQERASIENGFISSGNPGSSHYHYGSLPVGVDSSTEKIMRSYVNFDLPNLGASEIVTGASLNLVQYQQSFYASHMGLYTINIHQVLTDWDPNTMTWNSRGAGSNADYDHKVLDYIQLDGSENGNGTWDARYSSQASYLNSRSFDVTKVVRQWYQDPSSRHGLMLKAAVENGSYAVCGAYANFISKYYTTTPAGNYPVMVISYRSNKGLEGYWDYHSQDMGRAGTGYIQDYTGNLVYEHMDVSTPGGRMPVSISHYYNGYQAGENLRHDPYNIGSDNSALDVVPRTGMGWKLNLQQTLVAVHEESGLAGAYTHVYTDGDGTEHYFFEQDGKIIDEDGLGYTLSDGTHGGKRITTKDKSFLDFDAAGRLVYIENADGNHITVNLKMLGGYWVIDYVEDGAGDRITFQTDADTHLLTGLTDSAGRTTSYGYTGGGVKQLLTSITYPDGTETRFLYIGNRLTRVIDRTGIEMVYTYTNDGAYRVNSAYEKTGNTVGESLYATYGPDNTSTFVTSGVDNLDDADDIQTIYCFNNSGQTVSSSTALLSGGEFGGSVRNYTSPSGINPHSQKNNRIITEAQISLNVNNLLKNHSVEYDTDTWTPSHMGSNYGYTAELSSGEAYVGQRSVSLQKPPSYASDAVAIYQQDISLERGKMYTFSSYVKTENITSEYERSGAYLMVTYQDGSNSTVTAYPDEFLQGTTEGWTRTSLTFTVPSDAASPVCRMHLVLAAEAYGHAWFDGMQLEEGAIANPYNLVENPSFERYDTVGTPESWALSGRGAGDCVTGAEAKEGGLSYKMLGSPLVEKNISQGIMVGGTERDTYIFSAWAKADSVPVTEDLSRSFYACIKIRYTDGYETWTPGQSFNAQVGAWQYLSHVFTLDDGTDTERTPESVTYYLCYYRNANTAYFDNIQLIREDVPSYTYDNNGDLVSVTGRETTSQFSSDNGTLTKMVDTKEAYAYYNYSRETNTLLGARTKSGVEYTFTYDGNGNVTGTELVSNPLETAVRSGVAYNLRNKRSGLYLEVLGGWTGGQADGTLVVQGAAEDNIGQRWVMTAASGGYVVTPDYWRAGRLYVGSASAGTQAEIRNTSVNSVWAFQKNSDGTFSLKNTNSQRFLGLAGTSNDREEKAVLKDWDSRDESQKWYLERVTPVSGTKMTSSAAYTPDGAFVESMTDNFGHVTRYTTDTGKGLTTKVETLYGTEDVRTVDYTYDVSDRVKTVTSGTGSVEYTYANTRLSGIRHNGFDYLLTYDGFGNRTQTSVKGTDGVTRVLSTNTYGPSNGELERVTYGNGQSVAYSYDQLGRVRSQGNNGEYEWYYTNSGQLTDSYDYVNAVHTRYAYDTTGRLIRASTNQNQSAQYSYDVSNNVTKVLYRTFGQNRKRA